MSNNNLFEGLPFGPDYFMEKQAAPDIKKHLRDVMTGEEMFLDRVILKSNLDYALDEDEWLFALLFHDFFYFYQYGQDIVEGPKFLGRSTINERGLKLPKIWKDLGSYNAKLQLISPKLPLKVKTDYTRIDLYSGKDGDWKLISSFEDAHRITVKDLWGENFLNII